MSYHINPLLESTVARRLLYGGKLSPQSIRKLRRSDMVPNRQQLIDGINKGTDNMLRKMNAKVIPTFQPLDSASKTFFGDVKVTIPEAAKKTIQGGGYQFTPSQIALIRRHEAREAARNGRSRHNFLKTLDKLKIEPGSKLENTLRDAEWVYTHNRGVMSDEGKLLKQLRGYGYKVKDKDGTHILATSRANPTYSFYKTRDRISTALQDLNAKDENRIRTKIFKAIKENPDKYQDRDSIRELYIKFINEIRAKRNLKLI